MREVQERIRWARLNRTEFIQLKDAAASLNVKPGTYRTWEQTKSNGGRAPPLTEIQRLAQKFRVRWEWLATGNGEPDLPPEAEVGRMLRELVGSRGVPESKQEDAIDAISALLESYARKTA